MALDRPAIPVRTPPPRVEASPAPEPASAPRPTELVSPVPTDAPLSTGEKGNVAADAELLQAHLGNLSEQFDQMQGQLRQTQKLASIGTTAAMFAHEFNNLFTPVLAYAQQALDTGDVDLMKLALNKTLDRVAIVRQMADRVVGLARQPHAGVKSVKVAELVENAVGCLCRDLDKDNITVKVQIDESLAVRANENQLLQVLFNLVINARQAMLGRRGRLTIDANPTGSGQVVINIRDTGCGIEPENLDRIFEQFFSTKTDADKPDRRGLGLGLAICRDIIEEHDGTITVASEPGQGTTFTLILPQAE